jgi:hypothetical protein
MFRYYRLIDKYSNEKNFYAFSLLHTAEVFLLVYILARIWNFDLFITVLWGMIFHLFLDMISLAYKKKFFIRAYSVVEYLIRRPLLFKKGVDSDAFCREMFLKSKEPI